MLTIYMSFMLAPVWHLGPLPPCREREVFGGQGMSWLKIRLQIRETAHKVREATQFFSRGLRLMGSDLGNSGRLFVKAGSGGPSC